MTSRSGWLHDAPLRLLSLTSTIAAIRAVHISASIFPVGIFAFQMLLFRSIFLRLGDSAIPEYKLFARWLRHLVYLILAIAFVSGVLWFIAQGVLMSGRPLAEVVNIDILGTVWRKTRFGHVWSLRLCLGLVLAGLLYSSRRRNEGKDHLRILWVGTVFAIALAATLAWAGHAAATQGEEGDVHLAADVVHLLASGIWLGGLVPLVFVLRQARRCPIPVWNEIAWDSGRRFSNVALLAVGILTVTGSVNAWFLIGPVPGLFGTPYGRALLVKLSIFLIMIMIGAFNRFRLLPKMLGLPDAGNEKARTLKWLNLSVLTETVLGLGVLAAVGNLGVVAPASHTRIIWPFPFTLRMAGLDDFLAAKTVLVVPCISVLLGIAAISYGCLGRGRRHWWLLSGFAFIVVGIVIPLRLLAVPAHPTTYLKNPEIYTAQAIARGAELYAINCAPCHGEDGYGNGPMAAALSIDATDLASGHLHHHTDGDLFWWISHGIVHTPMPAFGDRLSETERWRLISFLHAQADAETANAMGPSVEPWTPLVAPVFVFEPVPGTQESLLAYRGRTAVLLVLYTVPGSLPRLDQLKIVRARIEGAGARIVAIAMGNSALNGSIYVTAGHEVVVTYGLFRRMKSDPDVPPLPSHMEFLIDRQGYLRARWIPQAFPGWNALSTLFIELDRLAHEPPHPPAPITAFHHH